MAESHVIFHQSNATVTQQPVRKDSNEIDDPCQRFIHGDWVNPDIKYLQTIFHGYHAIFFS
jgi:hypothetical protein